MPDHAFHLVAPSPAPRPLAEANALPEPGLPDHAAFAQIVDRHLVACRRNGSSPVVLSLGLVGIESIGAWYGRVAERQLLQAAWSRLRSRLRSTDVVVRIGAAEFGAVLMNAGVAAAASVQQRIPNALARPYRIEGVEIVISARLGVALHPQAGTTGEALVRVARQAREHSAEAV